MPAASGAELVTTRLALDTGTPTSVAVGTRVKLTGRVTHVTLGAPLPAIGRRVVLQQLTAAGWRDFARVRTGATGRFSVPAPTYYAGRHRVRVVVPSTLTADQATSEIRTVTARLGYRPRGRASAWNRLAAPGVRWNPCRTIPYFVNTAGAPRGAKALVDRAFRQIQQVSGLRFRYAGRTGLVPWRRGLPVASTFPAYGIAVAWSNGRTVPKLAGPTLGFGGPWLQSTFTDGRVVTRATGGGVVIDRGYPLRPGFGQGRTVGWVLLHELGHVIGLDHVADPRQVMHGTLRDGSATQLGAGDVNGFRQLGAHRGCL